MRCYGTLNKTPTPQWQVGDTRRSSGLRSVIFPLPVPRCYLFSVILHVSKSSRKEALILSQLCRIPSSRPSDSAQLYVSCSAEGTKSSASKPSGHVEVCRILHRNNTASR